MNKKKSLLGALSGLSLFLCAVNSNASPIVFSENFDAPTTGISYVGNATQFGPYGLLTPNQLFQTGAIWNTTAYNFSSFAVQFDFIIGPSLGLGADGLTFTVLDANSHDPNTALGGTGGGLGYLGLGNSFAVEFDTWNNGAIDGFNANHVGVNQNGSTNSLARADLPIPLETDDFGNWLTANITMSSSGSLDVYLNGVHYLSHNLSGYSNSAYFGFTAATGAARDDHFIDNWSMHIQAIPEPGILALLGLGLIGLGFGRPRKIS